MESEDVFVIFTGVVNNVKNLVIQISNIKRIRVCNVSGFTQDVWRFDYAASRLFAELASGHDWGSQIVEQLGPEYTAGAFLNVGNLGYDMIKYKITP